MLRFTRVLTTGALPVAFTSGNTRGLDAPKEDTGYKRTALVTDRMVTLKESAKRIPPNTSNRVLKPPSGPQGGLLNLIFKLRRSTKKLRIVIYV